MTEQMWPDTNVNKRMQINSQKIQGIISYVSMRIRNIPYVKVLNQILTSGIKKCTSHITAHNYKEVLFFFLFPCQVLKRLRQNFMSYFVEKPVITGTYIY